MRNSDDDIVSKTETLDQCLESELWNIAHIREFMFTRVKGKFNGLWYEKEILTNILEKVIHEG